MSVLRRVFCAMILFFGVCLYAEGQVCLYPDENVLQMMEKHKSFNVTMDGKSSGYRVQIFFSSGNNSREQAYKVKNEFSLIYPKTNAYVTFKEPNFRVRVGDFRTRAEAVGFLKEIEASFPQCFVVKDDISYVRHEYSTQMEDE